MAIHDGDEAAAETRTLSYNSHLPTVPIRLLHSDNVASHHTPGRPDQGGRGPGELSRGQALIAALRRRAEVAEAEVAASRAQASPQAPSESPTILV